MQLSTGSKGGAILPEAKKRRTEAVVRAAAFHSRAVGAGKRDSSDLTELECFQHGARPVTDAHLGQDIGYVILHSSLGYAQ